MVFMFSKKFNTFCQTSIPNFIENRNKNDNSVTPGKHLSCNLIQGRSQNFRRGGGALQILIPQILYRPPSPPAEFFDHFQTLNKVIDNEDKEMYILGDLNCDTLKTDKDSNTPAKRIRSLYELYQLSQLIDEPTRITMSTNSLIDHIVTNTPEKNLRFCSHSHWYKRS